jgi:hypothetical protein
VRKVYSFCDASEPNWNQCFMPPIFQVPSCYEVATWEVSKKDQPVLRTIRKDSSWKWLRSLCKLKDNWKVTARTFVECNRPIYVLLSCHCPVWICNTYVNWRSSITGREILVLVPCGGRQAYRFVTCHIPQWIKQGFYVLLTVRHSISV